MSAPSHRKSHLRQETPDFPSTHSIEPKKKDHTPYPKLKSPKPQNPHPPPVTFPLPINHPNSARPAPRRRSTPDAGLVSPAATNRKHPPTNPNPAAGAPISAHSTFPTTAHTHTQNAIQTVGSCPSRKRANEMSAGGQFFRLGFGIWEFQHAGARRRPPFESPAGGKGYKWMVGYQMRPVSGGFRGW